MSEPRSTRKSGKAWTADDDDRLRELAGENTPTRVIGLKLGRSAAAIYGRASRIGVSLKPTNQYPFSRRDEEDAQGRR